MKISYKILVSLIIILFSILIIGPGFIEPEVNKINKVILNKNLNLK